MLGGLCLPVHGTYCGDQRGDFRLVSWWYCLAVERFGGAGCERDVGEPWVGVRAVRCLGCGDSAGHSDESPELGE